MALYLFPLHATPRRGLSVTAKLAPINLDLASVGIGFKLVFSFQWPLAVRWTVGHLSLFRGYLINRLCGGIQPVAHAYGYKGVQIAEVYLADAVTSEWIRSVEIEDLPGRDRAGIDFYKLNWHDEYYLPDN